MNNFWKIASFFVTISFCQSVCVSLLNTKIYLDLLSNQKEENDLFEQRNSFLINLKRIIKSFAE